MGSQMIQIIILAGIALFLIFRLRNVLGTREGFEKPQETAAPLPARQRDRSFDVIEGGTVDLDIADFADPESDIGKALADDEARRPRLQRRRLPARRARRL